jgi:hypothetical protein
MPRDLWPTDGVEYSRVRKEITAALSAQHEAEAEAERYRAALIRAERLLAMAAKRGEPSLTKKAFRAIQEGLEVQ